jgi:hypothetical protein
MMNVLKIILKIAIQNGLRGVEPPPPPGWEVDFVCLRTRADVGCLDHGQNTVPTLRLFTLIAFLKAATSLLFVGMDSRRSANLRV